MRTRRISRATVLIIALATVVWGAPGRSIAGPPAPRPSTIVKDIDTTPMMQFGDSALAGNLLFFVSAEYIGERTVLWRTDGTLAGTRTLHGFGEYTGELTAVGARVLFAADDGVHGLELWRSDGTRQGTVLVKDLVPGRRGSDPANLTAVGPLVYFFAGGSLYRTDGTARGTVVVKAGITGTATAADAGSCWFGVQSGTSAALWRTDGTPAGTTRVASWNLKGVGSQTLDQFTLLDGKLYFVRSNAGDEGPALLELWVSDGTASGTQRLTSAGGNDDQGLDTALFLTPSGHQLFFASGTDVWRTDGTPAGTRTIGLSLGLGSDVMVDVNGTLYASTDTGFYVTDGTRAGTHRVRSDIGLASAMALDGRLYFTPDREEPSGVELWSTDGTPAGTRLVRDLNPGIRDSSPALLGVLGDTLYLGAYRTGQGVSLYATTATGDVRRITLLDARTFGSSPSRLIRVGDRMLFGADWEIDGSGGQFLWHTDGSAVGTKVIRDSENYTDAPYVVRGNTAYFAAFFELAAWDATTRRARTVRGFGSIGSEIVAMGRYLYFAACDRKLGTELWRSDGTRTGTRLVKDIHPGADRACDDDPSTNSTPRHLAVVGHRLYFAAADGVHGRELWRSDGTAAGTVMVKNIRHGGSGRPDELTAVGRRLYFTADDGVHGRELWRSDGTAAGTVMVRNVNGRRSAEPQQLTTLGGRLLYTASGGARGREPWISDGTRLGTHRLRDVRAGRVGSEPQHVIAIGRHGFFTANDGGHGRELWTTDGTSRGTRMVEDVRPDDPTDKGAPVQLTGVGTSLVFTANDGVHGREPWVSDGTAAGTYLLSDVNPRGSSYAHDFVRLRHRLMFAADDGVHGQELMTMPW